MGWCRIFSQNWMKSYDSIYRPHDTAHAVDGAWATINNTVPSGNQRTWFHVLRRTRLLSSHFTCMELRSGAVWRIGNTADWNNVWEFPIRFPSEYVWNPYIERVNLPQSHPSPCPLSMTTFFANVRLDQLILISIILQCPYIWNVA